MQDVSNKWQKSNGRIILYSFTRTLFTQIVVRLLKRPDAETEHCIFNSIRSSYLVVTISELGICLRRGVSESVCLQDRPCIRSHVHPCVCSSACLFVCLSVCLPARSMCVYPCECSWYIVCSGMPSCRVFKKNVDQYSFPMASPFSPTHQILARWLLISNPAAAGATARVATGGSLRSRSKLTRSVWQQQQQQQQIVKAPSLSSTPPEAS